MAKGNISRRQILQERREKEKRKKQTTFIILGLIGLTLINFRIINRSQLPIHDPVSSERMNQHPSKGVENPLVILTEFGDFGCEACQAWHNAGILDQILTQFDGLVQIQWRDFPIIMPPFSLRAAEAGQCAFDQNKFWEFHDITYERTAYSGLKNNDLLSYAKKANLDMTTFTECFDSGKYVQTVDIHLSFARTLGLRSTPSFTINGTPVIGANPDLLISMLESEISNTQK